MSITVGVIGAGIIARDHLEALGEMTNMRAVAVADVEQTRAEQAASRFGIKPHFDYRSMVEHEKPDAVVIALPHYLHREVSLFCADRGCHILLEKPMALDEAECDEIIQAAAAKNVVLMVGHTPHFDRATRTAREIVLSQSLGDLVMVNDVRHVQYYTADRPAWFFDRSLAGGGIFMNLGCHSVDKVQWITDSRITHVRASLSHFGAKGDIEGSGTAFVQTSRAVPALINQCGYGSVIRSETELIFTRGIVSISDGQLFVTEDGRSRELDVTGSKRPLALELEAFAQSIETGGVPECSGEYGRSVVAVLRAFYRSHRENREVVL